MMGDSRVLRILGHGNLNLMLHAQTDFPCISFSNLFSLHWAQHKTRITLPETGKSRLFLYVDAASNLHATRLSPDCGVLLLLRPSKVSPPPPWAKINGPSRRDCRVAEVCSHWFQLVPHSSK